MNDSDEPAREDIAAAAQRQNTNLRYLIGSVGTLIAASRDLLKRIQRGTVPVGDEPTAREAETGLQNSPAELPATSPPTPTGDPPASAPIEK